MNKDIFPNTFNETAIPSFAVFFYELDYPKFYGYGPNQFNFTTFTTSDFDTEVIILTSTSVETFDGKVLNSKMAEARGRCRANTGIGGCNWLGRGCKCTGKPVVIINDDDK
jgi:hypothetical protein